MKIFWNDWFRQISEEFFEKSGHVVHAGLDRQGDLASAIEVVF